MIDTLAAARRPRLASRRARAEAAEPRPEPVPTLRATVIEASVPLPDEDAARAWLRAVDLPSVVEESLVILNGVLHAHRVAAADPYAREVAADAALAVRVGYGAGEQVADGAWSEARRLPSGAVARARREAALRPQERLAALLGRRDAALACEELALRARSDLAAGREREMVLQTHIALEAAVAELAVWRATGSLAPRLDDLEARREPVARAARAALTGALEPEGHAEAREALEKLEATLRARTAPGIG